MTATREVIVRLLGVPEIREAPQDYSFPSKGFQLLALLVRTPSRRVTRGEAAALLWDGADRTRGGANLRQLLVRLRRAVPQGRELIKADAETLALGPEAGSIDLARFEALGSSGDPADLVEAVRLVKGDLLAGVIETSEEFQHWLLRERSAVREQILAVASAALLELTRYGRARSSDLVMIGERMLAIEPEREETYRALIEAHGRNGDLERARRLNADLKEMLRRELGVAPGRETAAVSRRIEAEARAHIPRGELELPAGLAGKRPRVALMAPVAPFDANGICLVRALIEDVANELARYRTFSVLAPHSSFRVNHDSGLPIDNGCLRADYTVSGFVKPGGSLLSLRMTRCESAEIIWAGEFGVGRSELVQSFRLLSVQIAANLAQGIERDVRTSLRGRGLAGAYSRYLEGDIQLKACDLPGLRRARAAYRAALNVDRGLADAHARIAQTLYLEWLLLGGNDPALLHAGRREAVAAVDIDPGAALGHTMSAVVALYQRDFDLSAEKFAEAEALNPNSADLLVQHADALTYIGGSDAAWQCFDRAIELNPLPPDRYWWVGASIAQKGGDFRRAIDLCDRMESDEPVLRLLAVCHALAGHRQEAREYGRRLLDLYPGLSAAEMVKLVPFRDPGDLKLFVEGLQMAGIP